MPDYMVLFDPLTHSENDYVPPDPITGGIVGDTENGILAIYDVPDGLEKAFEDSVNNCPSAIKCEVLP